MKTDPTPQETVDFKEKALRQVGLWGHPKADKVWGVAYNLGHEYGESSILYYLSEIATIFDGE